MKVTALGLVALFSACFTQPTAPGPGAPGPAAASRLGAEARDGAFLTVQRACAAAAQSPSDLRAQAKALELSTGWFKQFADQGPARQAVLQAVAPIAAGLESGPSACEVRPALAEMYEAARQDSQAADLLLRAVRQCGSVQAAIAAARPLGRLERCDEAIGAVREVWPRARQEEWTSLLNAAARCSTPISLRQNLLSFAPPAVVTSYLEELERERQVRAEAERRAEDESRLAAARFACESDCDRAVGQCRSGCPGGQYYSNCASNCDSVGSLCRAHCH